MHKKMHKSRAQCHHRHPRPAEETKNLRWEKLSPNEFQQLQELAQDSNKKLKDVLEELIAAHGTKFNPDGDIDYEGFRLFVNTFLEVETPDELCRHLFLSFVKKPAQPPSSPQTSGSGNEEKNSKDDGEVSGGSPGPKNPSPRTSPKVDGSQGSLTSSNSSSSSKSSRKSLKKRSVVTKLRQRLHRFRMSHRRGSGTLRSRTAKRKDHGGGSAGGSAEKGREPPVDISGIRISLKEIICYLSLLEGGRPEDKLEFMFRLYDTDGNGVLDTFELDNIVNQMMKVAEYLGWDVSELKPILQDMMLEIDYDADGTVSLEEWKRGGLTTIPLLVLLGLDQNVKEDGTHFWRLKHFNRSAYCNFCLNMLVGVGKKGLCCVFCKYTVHERCVQRNPATCIATYVKSRKAQQVMHHHWVMGNCHGKCSKCKKKVKSGSGMSGQHCRWCHMTLHTKCVSGVKTECTLGAHRSHIIPPICICPVILDRQRSFSRDRRANSSMGREEPVAGPSRVSLPFLRFPLISFQQRRSSSEGGNIATVFTPGATGPTSFQISPLPDTRPLLVFINPKSGGRQGPRLLRKFQYILNPRQVYNLAHTNPWAILQMFKDVPSLRIICCGGDGTVGWILDTMDKIQFAHPPTVGVIPLGTGNDLARCLRWGGGYEGESLNKILEKIEKATEVMMDRWEINISQDEVDDKPGDPIPFNIINNYFSVGVDAAICVKFHVEREKNPHKFNSRMRNKMWYFEYGMTEQFASSCKNLHQEIEVECDGVALDLSQGPALQGLAILNIPYTHGGTNLWGDQLSRKRANKRTKRGESEASNADISTAVQDIGDKLIEVIGLENCLHMGQVKTGLRASGKRLAQCSTVVIRSKKRLPMQIDGEPWMQPPSTIRISHKNRVPMLMAPEAKPKSFFSIFKRKGDEEEEEAE